MDTLKTIIKEADGNIVLNDKTTELILEASNGNSNSAKELVDNVVFSKATNEETKNQILKQLALLALDMCIEQGKSALSLLYINNDVVPYISDLISFLHEKAEKGYDVAQYILSVCYEDGIGVDKDGEKAYSLCLNAAASGHHEAIYKLALLHRDRKFSIALLNEIKDDDDETSWARATLSMLKFLGAKNVEIGYKEAIELLRYHIVTPHFPAICFTIGYCYTMGTYVDEDKNVGSEFLHKAVERLKAGGKAQELVLIVNAMNLDLIKYMNKLKEDFDDITQFDYQPLEDLFYIVEHIMEPEIQKLKKDIRSGEHEDISTK